MMLKPFHVKSDDGKTFYSDTRADRAARCNDTAPVAPIGDDEVNKLVLSTLSKLNSRFLWDTMTRESGPYDIDKVNYQFTLFARALLEAVAAQGAK